MRASTCPRASTSRSRPAPARPSAPALAVAIPEGYAGFVQPRSGLAAKHDHDRERARLVDSGYRGEVMVVLLNTDSAASFDIEPGMRIAQLVVVEVPSVQAAPVQELPDSERGARGHGSSGT